MDNTWFTKWLREDPITGCLLWTGGRKKPPGLPYGLAVDYRRPQGTKRLRPAHRIAWELVHGDIPAGHSVCHHCDNPPCCKTDPDERYPDGHLFTGTQIDNEADKVAKGRQAFGDRNGNRVHVARRPRGMSHGAAKLTDEDVIAMRATYDAGLGSTNTLAREYGIRQSTCWEIVRRRTWRHLP